MISIFREDIEYILDNTSTIINENLERKSKIFLTGATGFFGKWLLETLIFLNRVYKLDLHIVALSRNPERFLSQSNLKNENCLSWIKGDIADFTFPKEEFQYIIHAATNTDARLYFENPAIMLDTIIFGTKRMLEFARFQPSCKALLFTSSGAVYGKQPEEVHAIKEVDSFKLNLNDISSTYAEGKRVSELYCLAYLDQYKIPIKIARCFAFIGPYLPLDKHYAIGNFIRDGLNSQDIIVHGNGLPLRSYMYPGDLMIWLLTILLKANPGEIYNVGSDKAISIKNLAFMIAGFFPGINVKILNTTHQTDRNQNYIPDVSKAKNEFKFKTEVSLNEAILRTILFHKQYD